MELIFLQNSFDVTSNHILFPNRCHTVQHYDVVNIINSEKLHFLLGFFAKMVSYARQCFDQYRRHAKLVVNWGSTAKCNTARLQYLVSTRG